MARAGSGGRARCRNYQRRTDSDREFSRVRGDPPSRPGVEPPVELLRPSHYFNGVFARVAGHCRRRVQRFQQRRVRVNARWQFPEPPGESPVQVLDARVLQHFLLNLYLHVLARALQGPLH